MQQNITKLKHFTQQQDEMYAGRHIIIDLWGITASKDYNFIKSTLTCAATTAGATILNQHFHTFNNGGITGVLLLAESHISIHTWPEIKYAAIDIFMCGNNNIDLALEVIEQQFEHQKIKVSDFKRGLYKL